MIQIARNMTGTEAANSNGVHMGAQTGVETQVISGITLTIFILFLLFLPSIAQTAVYKHVDEHGKLLRYSDLPQKPGDKPISLPKPSMVYESEKPAAKRTFQSNNEGKNKSSEQESKVVIAYTAVAIMKPDDEEAIRANNGSITIELVSQPRLDTKSGHRYVIVVDGEKHSENVSNKFSLENMGRGAHSISAEIRDGSDTVLVSSSSKTIYVLRATAR